MTARSIGLYEHSTLKGWPLASCDCDHRCHTLFTTYATDFIAKRPRKFLYATAQVGYNMVYS